MRSDRIVALGRRSLFTVEGVTYYWDDVLAWAAARGTLDEQRRCSRRGLASVRRLAEREERLEPEDLSTAAARFRYHRRLLAAEELDAWLRRWDVTVGEWGGYLERTLLLERGGDDADPSPGDAELAEAEYVDAVCSGFLEREAVGFAADTALADLTPLEAADDRAVMVEWTLNAAARARASAVTESRLEQEIARRGVDWTRLDLDVLALAEPGAAREAALCIRVEGRPIDEVAADCHSRVSRLSAYLADLDPSLQPLLLSAQPGELVGPVEEDGGFALLAVHEREPAAASDPELRRRAETALVDRAVRRATEGRVEWHERL